MKKRLLIILLSAMANIACAQVTQMLGDWRTVDDKTGNSYAFIHIYRATDGLYYGKIAKMLYPGTEDLHCIACTGKDANAPLTGLVIIRGMHEENGELHGGKVLDPESGKFYYGKIFLKDGNLVLRGSLDKRGILGRNQTWVR